MDNIEICDFDDISIATLSSVAGDEISFGTPGTQLSEFPQTPSELNASTPVISSMGGGPTVDRIGIETSTDVTIGNQTYFQGTVIIKNLLTSSDPTNGSVIENGKSGKKRNTSENLEANKSSDQEWQCAGLSKKRLILIAALLGAILLIGVISLIVFLLGEY